MNGPNPIFEDYKLLLVFRNIGAVLLQRFKDLLLRPPYSTLYKDVAAAPKNEIRFTYLEHRFLTTLELFFNYSRMPQTAFIATYLLRENDTPEEIIRYSFDLNFNVSDIYTADDFAEYYIVEFHENLKKSFSEHHSPFPIRIGDK